MYLILFTILTLDMNFWAASRVVEDREIPGGLQLADGKIEHDFATE